MPGKECPCRGCVDRDEACHGRCERYQGWKTDFETAKHNFEMANIRSSLSKGMMKHIYRRMKEGRLRK